MDAVTSRSGDENSKAPNGGFNDKAGLAKFVEDTSNGRDTEVEPVNPVEIYHRLLIVNSIVAVPAIGARPKRSWVPYLLQHPRERTVPLYTASLPSPPSKTLDHTLSPKSNATDTSEKPSTTSQDIDQDGRDTARGPWLTDELHQNIPQARILLYDHGMLAEGDDLETLAERLLEKLCQVRKVKTGLQGQLTRRPAFFICHSTGGLVGKDVSQLNFARFR